MNTKHEVTFVTSSAFKREESAAFLEVCSMQDGTAVGDLFEFNIAANTIKEPLDVSLTEIVSQEVRAAYSRLKKPCFVEHAGLVFRDYAEDGYPGGLTKPMWNTLGDHFLDETHSAGRSATAVATIGYCDGMKVHTFIGETVGTLSHEPRGDRAFYWDTIFIPSESNDEGLTYAEIVAEHGLAFKMRVHSQSAKAMLKFLEWRRNNEPALWKINY